MGDEWALVNDEGVVEDDFWSKEEAELAMRTRYSDEDDLTVVNLQEYLDDEDGEDDDCEDDGGDFEYPVKH